MHIGLKYNKSSFGFSVIKSTQFAHEKREMSHDFTHNVQENLSNTFHEDNQEIFTAYNKLLPFRYLGVKTEQGH